MSKFTYVVSSSIQGIKCNLAMSVAILISTTISLSLIGVALLLKKQTELISGFWYKKAEISVYLCNSNIPEQPCSGNDTTDADKENIKQNIDQYTHSPKIIQKVYFETQEKAYENFKEEFKHSSLVELTSRNQFQDSYRLKLSPRYIHNNKVQNDVIKHLKSLPNVQSVQNDKQFTKPIINFMESIKNISIFAAIIISLLAMLLISNAIRIAIVDKSDEIQIMRLIGSTRFYIQLPFLCQYLFVGMISVIISTSALLLVYNLVIINHFKTHIVLFPIISLFDVIQTIFYLFIIGMTVISLTSLAVLRKRISY